MSLKMVKLKLTIALLFSTLIATQSEAANLYKYTDDQGREIVSSRVPAEFVRNGYQILNERGQVIEVVERSLSAEELAVQSEEKKSLRLAEQARLEQEEADTMLLRLYRSPEEVIRRRDSTVSELDGQFTVLSSLLEDVEEKLAELEQKVVNNENAGNEVPANLIAQVEDATVERDRLSRQVTRISNEKEEAIVTAQNNIDRLKELLSLD
ncbi:MAG: hypothetical protein ACI934_000064 [Pseudohongiellaceae bacterium]|jgi:hypothetical protein